MCLDFQGEGTFSARDKCYDSRQSLVRLPYLTEKKVAGNITGAATHAEGKAEKVKNG